MLRFALCPLVLIALVMSCMGQTFQYSRGWTNGKRSQSSHVHNSPATAAEARLLTELQGYNRILPFARGHGRFKYSYLPHFNSFMDPVETQYFLANYGAVPSGGLIHHRSKEDAQDFVQPELHEFPMSLQV